MPGHDFANPFVAASITTKDGDREFPFWTSPEHVVKSGTFGDGGDDPQLKSLAFLQEVVVELQLAYIPIITLTLAPPFRDAVAFLDSELIEWGRSRISVQFGYVGGKDKLSQVYSGVMLKPDITIGEDVNIAINAQGTGVWTLSLQEGTTSAKDQTRREYLDVLVKGPEGKKQTTIDYSIVDASAGPHTELLKAPCTRSQGGKSYFQEMFEVADECRCTFLVQPDGNTIQLIPNNTLVTKAPRKTLVLYDFPRGVVGGPDGADTGGDARPEVYPILSLSSPTAAIYMPASIRGIDSRNVSDSTRTESKVTTNEATIQRAQSGKDNVAAPKGTEEYPEHDEESASGGEHVFADPEDPSDLAHLQSLFQREGNMGITLDVETVGIPDLLPGEVVEVEGVGRRLGGQRWTVHKVIHSIGLGGYSSNLHLISTGFSKEWASEGTAATGPAATAPRASEEGTQATPENYS